MGLTGRRVTLRPLRATDFSQWAEIRHRCHDWLTVWEPTPPSGSAEQSLSLRSFLGRCAQRDRERAAGSGFGFGIFVGQQLVGEISLAGVQRGPFQSATIGYWVDQAKAGNGYVPEAVAVLLRFAFEELALHRVEIGIVPRNRASRRVAEKLALREEGVARGLLEINGRFEDHVRYAITAEEYQERRAELIRDWMSSASAGSQRT